MTVEQLGKAHSARPFRPFGMKRTDATRARRPESLACAPDGRSGSVGAVHDEFEMIDLRLATSLEFSGSRSRGGNGR